MIQVNEHIRKVAEKEFIKPKLFVEFMEMRFPNESCISYIMEWVERFKSGNPLPYMDSQSLLCYKKAVEEVGQRR